MQFTAPIVGQTFRPPSARVIDKLPAACELILRRQPDNPYDENAIQVLLEGFSPEGKFKDLFEEMLKDALPDDLPAGKGLWNVSSLTDPLFLGFVAAKTGEAKELSAYMDAKGLTSTKGWLTFSLQGLPSIDLTLE